MAALDVKEAFPTTENAAGLGVTLSNTLEGQASAGLNGAVGFAFKDASGNVILPQLDAQGRVPVSIEGQGTRLRTRGAVAGSLLVAGASPDVYTGFAIIASIPVTVAASGRQFIDMKGSVQCRRDALIQMVYADAGSTVVLDEVILGPGQYSAPIGIDFDTFLVPASAITPTFQLRGGNFSSLSDLKGAIKVVQF